MWSSGPSGSPPSWRCSALRSAARWWRDSDFPARHIAEGAATYLDINLIFVAATLFMNLLKESGGVTYVVRSILKRFHRSRALLLVLLTVLLLVPGALTGAGSVTVLVAGSLVAVVLHYMGIPKHKAAALIFINAGLSAAAPPVSLWAMMTAAGVNMPYVGFFWPLLLPCLVAGLATSFILGWKGEGANVTKALEELPPAPPGMAWWRLLLPFVGVRRAGVRRAAVAVLDADPRPAADVRGRRAGVVPRVAGAPRVLPHRAGDGGPAPAAARHAHLRGHPGPRS